jgi:hypothetical protein
MTDSKTTPETRLLAAFRAAVEAMCWYVPLARRYEARCAAEAAAFGVLHGTTGEHR